MSEIDVRDPVRPEVRDDLRVEVDLEVTGARDDPQDHPADGPAVDEGVAEPAHDPGRRLRAAIEAVLMVADEPVPVTALARATGELPDEVDLLLRELAGEYAEAGRGFELREVGGGWRVYSRAEHADVVEAFLLDGQTAKLTQAALETLSIVAYRQPVSRARVSAVRGVSVDGVMRTLLTRGLVSEAGVEATSGATLYRTTEEFLQRMGLDSLDDLPPLAPFLPEELSVEDLEPREVLAPPVPVAPVGPVADPVATGPVVATVDPDAVVGDDEGQRAEPARQEQAAEPRQNDDGVQVHDEEPAPPQQQEE